MLGITLKETRVYREIKEEGREEGRREEAANLIIRLLTKRFGQLSGEMRSSISGLSLPVLENLSEALLDFSSLADLPTWLEDVLKVGGYCKKAHKAYAEICRHQHLVSQ